MVIKLYKLTIVSEFDSHWAQYTSSRMLNLVNDKNWDYLCKLTTGIIKYLCGGAAID